ncbi:biopolymer transporter ExbD [Myxococcota bacterium]|nr:biopolymer transporter ExbD [Myxococcota bacterium]
MSFDTGGSKGPKGDINVTPLVDVVLVLLIIFMVITPMMDEGAPVELPKLQNTASKEDSSDDLLVSVTRDGRLWLDEGQVDEAGFRAKVGPMLAAEPNKPVMIRGDVNGRYGDVRRAMQLTQELGARQVALMADKDSDEMPAPGDKNKESR